MKSANLELQSPNKVQQNQSEVMNSQMSPDKDKKPEKTRAEAVILAFFKVFLLENIKK